MESKAPTKATTLTDLAGKSDLLDAYRYLTGSPTNFNTTSRIYSYFILNA
jgi:hypothetical protein